MRLGPRASFTCGLVVAFVLIGCETVVVSVVEVAEVEVVPSTITVLEGDTETAGVVLRESGGMELSGRPVSWTVDDPDIATVSEDGVVQGLAPGTTTVRASSEGVTGTAAVTVVSESDEPPGNACDVEDRLLRDVEIPKDASCVFSNVRVRGRLELREGSSLVASQLTVDGDVTANGAEALVLTGARIYGELRFEKGGSVTIRDTYVGRKVELKENLGAIAVSDSDVEETLKLEANRGGPFTLVGNTADRLECKENDPSPTGSGNLVSNLTGQCVGL